MEREDKPQPLHNESKARLTISDKFLTEYGRVVEQSYNDRGSTALEQCCVLISPVCSSVARLDRV